MDQYYKYLIKYWTKQLKYESDPKLRHQIREGLKEYRRALRS